MSHLAVIQETDFDPRLHVPFSCMIDRTSRCGKTSFVKNVLEKYEYAVDLVPENTVWIYTSFQTNYVKLQ